MRKNWIVCWRGVEELFPCLQDAMDRLDQLEACGVEAAMFAMPAGERHAPRG
jgi:hypothetical protein